VRTSSGSSARGRCCSSSSADDAVDELEEAAALVDLSILIAPSAAAVAQLRELADLPLRSAQELVKCVECAASVTQFDVRDDLDGFLAALEKLIAIEHAADEGLRAFRRWLILENVDQRRNGRPYPCRPDAAHLSHGRGDRMRHRTSLADAIHRIPFDGAATQIPNKETVGSKAHNLMRLAGRGLPVPPAFVLGTQICRDYLRRGEAALEGLAEVLDGELQQLALRTGRHFGDVKRPLLVSVRSGAAISMPGMMETVLNVGLTEATLRALIRMTGNPRLAYDCRCRLVQQYGEVVHAIAPARFEARRNAVLAGLGVSEVDELDTGGLGQMAEAFGDEFETATGERFPSDPHTQLEAAIAAVFRSWASVRAQSYRKLNGIPEDLGTAATVQAMVFGNLGPASGSGRGLHPQSGGR
jgi:Pyruvate phosphate dikinase, AMP/ATP-binding domain